MNGRKNDINAEMKNIWKSLANLDKADIQTAALCHAIVTLLIAWRTLNRLPVRLANDNHYGDWVPFVCACGLFLLAFHGLAYSLFPYLVLDQVTIWDSASAPESLMIIFVGAVFVLPVIIGYSVFAYRVFLGKASKLEYY